MKIQLIRPPFDSWCNNKGQMTELEAPPIGLAIIAKCVRDADVEIIDGLNLPLDEIVKQINGNIIGVSDIYSNHLNSLKILKEAKNKGAVTFIGGTNVTYLAENILKNHSYVDYAVIGDGENSLSNFISGEDIKEIPNLIYRKDSAIIRNQAENAPLTTLFDLEKVANLHLNPSSALLISSIRGCIKAEKGGRCSFCSIRHPLRVMQPELVWEQIRTLNEKYGSEFFYETGDSFMVRDFPEKLLSARPKKLRQIQIKFYASPDQINNENIKILKELNARDIFLGVESVNDSILGDSGKSYRRTDIENAIALLDEHHISPVQVTFVYGLPGETKESAEETLNFAKRIAEKHPNLKIFSSLPIPFPGTQLFNNIKNHPEARKEYDGDLDKDDFFDYKKLIQIQTKYFTSVEYDVLCEYARKTWQLAGE